MHRRRSVRVAVLVTAIALMSLGDLYMTLTFLTHGGMSEGNPIARWVMSFNCEWLLSAWKVILLGVTCGLLLLTRRTRSAEIAAWFCVAVMVWLSVRWITYAGYAAEAATAVAEVEQRPADWVRFDN
ncbi:MAG: DUF5658 family protein [Planctomycetaceae bacterium]|nr:hypothetical protein [Phycisphaerales bacterium]MCE2654085.1 DUF5658 family protein [Planctomycetaceae bacterium]